VVTLLKVVLLVEVVKTVLALDRNLIPQVEEKQAKQDMMRNAYSLVDFPIVKEGEGPATAADYCRERDRHKGFDFVRTGERESTEKWGKVVVQLASVIIDRMGSEVGMWVVDQVGVAVRDKIEMGVDATRYCIDLYDQANWDCTSPLDSW
jgi:hypothetical protein